MGLFIPRPSQPAPTGARVNRGRPIALGLRGHWTFDGANMVDLSGQDGHGTLSGSPTFTTSGRFGGGLTLDGVNDYANVPHSDAVNIGGRGLTVMAWWRIESTGDYQCLVSKNVADGSHAAPYFNYNLGCYPAPKYPRFYVALTGGSSVDAVGPTELASGALYHVAGVCDDASVRLYVDGVLVDTEATGGDTIRQSTSSLRIGSHGNGGEYGKGIVDDVRVYNRALTAAEIRDIMAEPYAAVTQ
jgi:hypothetical protein